MKGLLIKDFLGIRSVLKSSLFTVIVFLVVGRVSKNPMYIVMLLGVLSINLTFTSISYDKNSNWIQYSLTMPIKRRTMVVSKYIFFYILLLVSTLLASLAIFLLFTGVGDMSLKEIFLTNYSVLVTLSVMNAIILPIVIKKGIEKARIAILAVALLPTAIVILVSQLIPFPGKEFIESLVKRIVIFSPLILILINLISIKLSINIFENKEL